MKVPRRIALSLINSLKGGVVPRVGLPYITVGRKKEIAALLSDIDIISEGGATFRFIVGKYGSGKSFLLRAVANYAMDKGFVIADADLSPERRLYGTRNQGLATYKELIKNLSTRTKPDGGALSLILDKWINMTEESVVASSHLSLDSPLLPSLVEKKIIENISSLKGMVHGFEFSKLLALYYSAYISGDDDKKSSLIKWFRGEYTSKAEARAELGVGIIISDDDWYEYIKLLAAFLKGAGYKGLIVMIDELVNIYKIPNLTARNYNYEKILTIYNDTLQGKAEYIGFIMCGTPQCIEDPRRGVFSYEALRSRLDFGKFSNESFTDMYSPIIRLSPLSSEEMLVLADRLSDIHAELYGYTRKITDDDLCDFISIEYSRIGANANITPREVIRDFIELLSIAEQNPTLSVKIYFHKKASPVPRQMTTVTTMTTHLSLHSKR